MTHALLKEDGFYLLKEDGGKLLLEGAEGTGSLSVDFIFNMASSVGSRENPDLAVEFTRKVVVNLK